MQSKTHKTIEITSSTDRTPGFLTRACCETLFETKNKRADVNIKGNTELITKLAKCLKIMS